MSNFIKSDNDLIMLKEFADRLRNEGCDYCFLRDFLETFIIKAPLGGLLTNYLFDSTALDAGYSMVTNTLAFEIEGLLQAASNDASLILNDYHFKENNISDTECYTVLLILFHELEHSFQGLVCRDLAKTPSVMLNSCYQQQYDLMLKVTQRHNFYDRFRYALYMTFVFNASPSIFERNANIEAFNALLKLASLEGNDEMVHFLEDARLVRALFGYTLSRTGSLVTTSRFLLSSLFLDGKEEKHTLSFEEKVRYGLPLTRLEHDMLMQIPESGAENDYPHARRLIENIQSNR